MCARVCIDMYSSNLLANFLQSIEADSFRPTCKPPLDFIVDELQQQQCTLYLAVISQLHFCTVMA